jgi:tryptophan-rich sensory protein
MALNASWSPLFFGAHRPKASAIVAGAMVPTIAAYSLTARKIDKPAAALMLP